MRWARIIASVAVWLSLPATVMSGPILIGGTHDGVLYDIDPTTGTATNPRDTGLSSIVGLVFSRDGTLFGLENDSYGAYGGSLYTIDPATGAAALVGESGTALGSVGLDFDAQSSFLFTYRNYPGTPGGAMIRVDPRTGVGRDLGGVGQLQAFALDHTGIIWGLTRSELVVIDPVAVEITDRIPLSDTDTVWGTVGFAFGESGMAYVSPPRSGSGILYALDPSSGLLTAIGNTGVLQDFMSLVYVPEPSALLLLGAAVLVFVRRR